jgi:D-xylose transport system substrate-binding protein
VRRTSVSAATLGLVVVLGLAACGSGSGSNPGGGSSSAPAAVGVACSLAHPPVSAVQPPGSLDIGRTRGAVGVVIDGSAALTGDPQTVAAALTSALTHAGMTPDVRITAADPKAFRSAARTLISRGDRFLILDTLDAHAGARVERIAGRADVTVVDFDHLVMGGTARYLVSFDDEDAGRLQAQSTIDCLSAQGVTDPHVILLDGGLDIDNGAVLFATGAHEVLDPLVSAGKATLVEAAVDGWTLDSAAPAFQQALGASSSKVDGVIAADDDLADVVIHILKSRDRDGHVVISGRGAGPRGLRNVRAGQQSLTVVEDTTLEAQAAARLVAALIRGRDAEAVGLTLQPFTDPRLPGRQLEAVLLPARVVTRADVGGRSG